MHEDLLVSHALESYLFAREVVVRLGYEDEIHWQRTVSLERVSERDFMREVAWVVLSAGMSERVIRCVFPSVSSAFLNWISAEEIIQNVAACRDDALDVFRSNRKIDAIVAVVREISEQGFEEVKERLGREGQDYVVGFPYMGPATSAHLCKNLGLSISKPDRHLLRIADACGFSSSQKLCACLAEVTGDPVSVVDIVLWRYATLDRDYLDLFKLMPATGCGKCGL